MTRISAGIKPKELCDKHLNKERIEILRIPNSIKSGKANLEDIPKDYTLGKGHVKFFYNKIKYLHKRYNELTEESIRRKFNPTDFSSAFDNIPITLYNDWTESKIDRYITKERVNERLKNMREKDIKYCSEKVDLKDILIK